MSQQHIQLLCMASLTGIGLSAFGCATSRDCHATKSGPSAAIASALEQAGELGDELLPLSVPGTVTIERLAVAKGSQADHSDAANSDAAEIVASPTAADTIQLTSATAELGPGSSAAQTQSADGTFRIDLGSAMQLASGQNPGVAFARERINEAYAQHERAATLWLPSIRAGINWNKHEGRIQDVVGTVIQTSRGSWFGGLGANAVGAGSPAIPGVIASFHLTDAIHQPKIAEHVAESRQFAASAAEQDAMLPAAVAYIDLLKAHQELAIANDIQAKAQKLVELTKAYSDSGQGLTADYDRARTEFSVRRNDVLRADEAVKVASARLAQLLHIDPTVKLLPSETTVVPLSLQTANATVQELVASGLSQRPEICEQRLLVEEACERLRREQNAPLLPSVLLGLSYGGLGGGLGSNFASARDRLDADAVAYWELRNLGWGESAARKEAQSRVHQAQWRELAMLDRIAREVVEAHAQVESRRQQLSAAEDGIEAATSSFDRNNERIRNAQGLPLETLQSLQALAQARREYLRVVSDYNAAQFALQRALGWPNP